MSVGSVPAIWSAPTRISACRSSAPVRRSTYVTLPLMRRRSAILSLLISAPPPDAVLGGAAFFSGAVFAGALIASFVPVKLGLRAPGWVQVTPVGPPIRPGDQFVSSGVGGLILYPGVKLKLVDPVVTPEKPTMTDRKLQD